MLDLLREAVAANQAEAATYSPAVRIWMAAMALSFLSSLAFVIWKTGARWILAALVVNVMGLITLKAMFPGFSRAEIGTTVHLLFWTMALFMIWRPKGQERRQAEFAGTFGTVYRAWLIIVSLIMSVSLVLDARTALSWVFS